MDSLFNEFDRLARRLKNYGAQQPENHANLHPFDDRNIHPAVSGVCKKLFDNGHYSQATFEAFKLIEATVADLAGSKEIGNRLMMAAFDQTKPVIFLNSLSTPSESDEQSGYRFMFAGAMSAIRNPRAHGVLSDPIDLCLDHLSVASALFRILDRRKAP